MTATAAICAALLRGEHLSIKTAFDRFGVTNLPRELGRSVKRKFNVHISHVQKEGKSRFNVPCTWFEYWLNPLIEENAEGVEAMKKYVAQQKADTNPKTDKEIKTLTQLQLL